jgi:hypothetical protein
MLLTVHDVAGIPHGRNVMIALSLIRGPAPPRFGKIVSRRHSRPLSPAPSR